MRSDTWVQQAACNGVDLHVFHPTDARGLLPVEAMRYCTRCPVRRPCLDEILADSEGDTGIRGGTTERHRRHVRAGRMTASQAMALGDRIAQGRTDAELVAERPSYRTRAAQRRLAERQNSGGTYRLSAARRADRQRRRDQHLTDLERAHQLMAVTADAHDLPVVLLTGRSQHRPVVEARHEAMRLIRQQTSLSLIQIGDLFGRDHTTVLNAVRCEEMADA